MKYSKILTLVPSQKTVQPVQKTILEPDKAYLEDLDGQMSKIISSKGNVDQKVKLYGQALKTFMISTPYNTAISNRVNNNGKNIIKHSRQRSKMSTIGDKFVPPEMTTTQQTPIELNNVLQNTSVYSTPPSKVPISKLSNIPEEENDKPEQQLHQLQKQIDSSPAIENIQQQQDKDTDENYMRLMSQKSEELKQLENDFSQHNNLIKPSSFLNITPNNFNEPSPISQIQPKNRNLLPRLGKDANKIATELDKILDKAATNEQKKQINKNALQLKTDLQQKTKDNIIENTRSIVSEAIINAAEAKTGQKPSNKVSRELNNLVQTVLSPRVPDQTRNGKKIREEEEQEEAMEWLNTTFDTTLVHPNINKRRKSNKTEEYAIPSKYIVSQNGTGWISNKNYF